jgi:hypothetical protein
MAQGTSSPTEMPVAYLRRRIEALISDLKGGRALLAREVADQLEPELSTLIFREDGSVDLGSVSDHLRAVARTYELAKSAVAASESSASDNSRHAPDPKELARLNRELFGHLDNVFVAATGYTPADFAPLHGFTDAIRKLADRMSGNNKLAARLENGARDSLEALRSHYVTTNMARMRGSAALPGSKLALGGMQQFLGASLRAVRSMLLYCDTVLIPDPVFPFLETARPEERFARVKLLQQIFFLSRLRPLVDASLPYPAISVFPSWEKSLEAGDRVTQDGQELQVLKLMSHYCDATFDDIEEVSAYTRSHADAFAEAITRHHLLIPPGGDGTEPFALAVAKQREEHRTWRSQEFLKMLDSMPDGEVALSAIIDRLAPQFHLEENATLMTASPLIAVPQQWHYFRLLRRVETSALMGQQIIASGTNQLIEALNQTSVHWLGNVPIKDLVVLRMESDNERFRRELDTRLKELGGADQATLDTVTSRVVRALASMVTEYEKETRRIADEYQHKHTETAIGAWFTFLSGFLPLFPMITAAGGLAVVAKYATQKVSERMRYNQSRRTLMGLLAAASKSEVDE